MLLRVSLAINGCDATHRNSCANRIAMLRRILMLHRVVWPSWSCIQFTRVKGFVCVQPITSSHNLTWATYAALLGLKYQSAKLASKSIQVLFTLGPQVQPQAPLAAPMWIFQSRSHVLLHQCEYFSLALVCCCTSVNISVLLSSVAAPVWLFQSRSRVLLHQRKYFSLALFCCCTSVNISVSLPCVAAPMWILQSCSLLLLHHCNFSAIQGPVSRLCWHPWHQFWQGWHHGQPSRTQYQKTITSNSLHLLHQSHHLLPPIPSSTPVRLSCLLFCHCWWKPLADCIAVHQCLHQVL